MTEGQLADRENERMKNLQADNEQLRALLKRFEWAQTFLRDGYHCPCCRVYRYKIHKPDCEWKAAMG